MTIPKTLGRRLRNAKVIPFIGAGVSMAVKRADGGGRLFPNWRELLVRGADRLEDEGKAPDAALVRTLMAIDCPDLLYAARHLKSRLGSVWSGFLREQIDLPRAAADSESLALARSVWTLGSPLILTTNYDQVLKWACPEDWKDDLGAWDIEAVAEQARFLSEERIAPTVWHLHGRIRNVARLILTPDGYERLYGSDSQMGFQAAIQTLRRLLISHSLLFIGFSFEDEHLGVELKAVAEIFKGHGAQHYALVRERDAEVLKCHSLPVEILTFEDFGAPLVERVEDFGRCAASPPPQGENRDRVAAAVDSVELTPYLDALVSRTDHINISGISGTAAVRGALRHPIERLYTPLVSHGMERPAGRYPESGSDDIEEPGAVTLAELLPLYKRLLIEGQPGAGKTTFLRLVASMLGRDGLGEPCPGGGSWRERYLGLIDKEPSERGAPQSTLLTPVLLRIADLVPLMAANNATLRTHDRRWILDLLEKICRENEFAVSRGAWQAMLEGGSAMLLLDGLDEVADEAAREPVLDVFRDASSHWKCPIVVTSRPIQTAALQEMGFRRATIEPFGEQEIRTFVDRWVGALYGESADSLRAEGESYRSDLLAAIAERARVRRLATNPVMLTCLCVVHWNEGRLPEGRSRVYRAVIRWLIAARREQREEQGFTDWFAQRAVARLALAMVDARGGKRSVIDLDEGATAIDGLIGREFPGLNAEERRHRARHWLRFECLGSGILQEVAGSRVRFWHLTFQEFLAALQLAWRGEGENAQKDWWPLVADHLADAQWRETIELFPGCLLDEGGEGRVDRLLERVLSLRREERLASQAWVAGVVGRLLEPLKVYQYRPRPEVAEVYAEALERSLAIFTREGAAAVPVTVRIPAAEALGQAGDPRLRADNFLEVPAINGCRLGKYPVTVEEYHRFLEHRAYEEREWWSWEGWSIRKREGWISPSTWDEQLVYPNRPVTGLSWHEAAAFCRWLSHQRGEEIRLPLEVEWETAARPVKGKYPWGNEEPDHERANSSGGSPTPVGVYPLGDGPNGHCDLSGSIWEWCIDQVGASSRVLRGGGTNTSEEFMRIDCRHWNHASVRLPNTGFRLLVTSGGRKA